MAKGAVVAIVVSSGLVLLAVIALLYKCTRFFSILYTYVTACLSRLYTSVTACLGRLKGPAVEESTKNPPL